MNLSKILFLSIETIKETWDITFVLGVNNLVINGRDKKLTEILS